MASVIDAIASGANAADLASASAAEWDPGATAAEVAGASAADVLGARKGPSVADEART